MSENSTIMPNNSCAISNIPSTSGINQPAKLKINPMQLLTALSILLNEKGGIKSLEEVKRVAGLMGKYSKKLVSKCIYLNILEATDVSLLNKFYNEAGWDLVSSWLSDAISMSNWPLTKQILDLLLLSPVTVERLKQNNSTKMVKDLSRDCQDIEIKKVAEQIVRNWKVVVQAIGGNFSNENNKLEPETIEPVLAVTDSSSEIMVDPPTCKEESDSYFPKAGAIQEKLAPKRGRGARGARGRGRRRGRAKAIDNPSYADLLKQDLDNLTGQEKSINITIRNGPNVLVKVIPKKLLKKKFNQNKKFHHNLIESSDSDDNVPLSLIRKEVNSTTNLSGENNVSGEVISIESSDTAPMSDESVASVDKVAIEESLEEETLVKESKNVKLENKEKISKSNKSPPGLKDSNKIKNKERETTKENSKDSDMCTDKGKKVSIRNHEKKKDSERYNEKKNESERYHEKRKDSERKHKDGRKDKVSSKYSDKNRDRSKRSEKSKETNGDKNKKSEHRSKEKSGENSHLIKTSPNKQSSSRNKPKEEEDSCDQTELDQATLDKVKPLSTEGLAKIPRKTSSFLDALGTADNDVHELKKPAIKTKSRAFRNTGLLDETINRPGMAGKRTIVNSASPNLKRHRPPDLKVAEKRMKTSASSDLSTFDKPGGIKLISPKRPTILDDGGFMAALTAVGPERKRIAKKRRSSESDQKPEPSKIIKLEEADPEQNSSIDKETTEPLPEDLLLSPTSIRPVLNFYTERTDDCDVPKIEKVKKEELEKESSPPVNQLMENPDSDKTESQEESFIYEPAVPAPAQEDYETIEVVHTTFTEELKSVLTQHRGTTNRRKKKSVKWKAEENLTQTFLFPMDENERVNVNTLKFQDMMQKDRAFEKELMGKHRGRFGSPDLNPNAVDNCTEFMPWKLYPIHLPEESTVVYGSKSKEKDIQARREHLTMEMFFHPAMRPDTPSEPDAEMVQRAEPIIVPMKDVTGSDSLSDHRNIPWPDPVVNPPEMPFMPPSANHMSSPDGGHWIVGSHPTPRFGGDMFNGPGVCGPPRHQGPVFPGQNFTNNMRGPGPPNVWGPPPNEFGGPYVPGGPPPHMGGPGMRQPGPGMGQPGPGMGQPGPGMGQPGPGMGQSGPGMGMPLPLMQGRGAPRFKRGNWAPQNLRPCKHFMNGHCRNGNNCRFAHNQQR